MTRSFDISGKSLLYLFNAASLAVLAVVVTAGTWPPDDVGTVALILLVAFLLAATLVGAWRRRTGRDPEHLGTDEDLAYDPIAYPGDAARDAWRKSIRRLSGEDGEDDDGNH